jgi:hypothetical protein
MTAADAQALHLADLEVRYANLLAAARATVAADHDREQNPLSYIRDELDAHGQLPGDDMHPAEILALCTCDPARSRVMKHVNSIRVALAVVIAMIALPFVPGVSDRQINMILGGVAIVSIVGAAAGMVWQAITERKEDRESDDGPEVAP